MAYLLAMVLFNHESPRRGETFVTRKITRGLANLAHGLEDCLYLGNLDALRDWGHARDYVRMQWMMLQQETPQDFVIATGQQISVREFVTLSARAIGIEIVWSGEGKSEIGVVGEVSAEMSSCIEVGQVIVGVDEAYFRPTEVETLLGDPSLAKSQLGWAPECSFTSWLRR